MGREKKIKKLAGNSSAGPPTQATSAYDLPSVSSLVHLRHASAGNPVPSTWFAAIKTGNYKTFPGLTLRTDLEIGHPRFRALGRALRRAGLGQHFFAALAALRPKGTLDLEHPSKIFSHPRYLI